MEVQNPFSEWSRMVISAPGIFCSSPKTSSFKDRDFFLQGGNDKQICFIFIFISNLSLFVSPDENKSQNVEEWERSAEEYPLPHYLTSLSIWTS